MAIIHVNLGQYPAIYWLFNISISALEASIIFYNLLGQRQMRQVLIGFWALLLCVSANAHSDYPKLALSNELITVSLYLPDAEHGYYRGPRFDWSGIIERVDYAGHRFYGPLHETHNPNGHDFVSGPAEEFGMYNPMGFSEAAEGESFVKIGVGLLRKGASDEYQFYGDYPITRAGEWQIQHGPNWVDFEQELKTENGWGYRYHKRIELVSGRPEMAIIHHLTNTGKKTIELDNYNHNFTIIDDVPYGPDYQVEFPFSTTEPKSVNDLAWYRGNAIELDQVLGEKALWAQVLMGGGPASYNGALVRNNKTGASVSFKGDVPITHFIFWAVERAVCPEPFILIKLAPGEVHEWTSRYTFSVDQKQ